VAQWCPIVAAPFLILICEDKHMESGYSVGATATKQSIQTVQMKPVWEVPHTTVGPSPQVPVEIFLSVFSHNPAFLLIVFEIIFLQHIFGKFHSKFTSSCSATNNFQIFR